MANESKPNSSEIDGVKCADDFPKLARLLARQQFLGKWYKPVALAPFALMLFVIFKFFPNTNGGLGMVLVFLTLGWALAVAGYSLYLIFALQCPVCTSRYGTGQSCRSCGLSRHRESTAPISLPKLV